MKEYIKEQELILKSLNSLFDFINEIGKSFSGSKKEELGVVKKTFLVLLERINRNIDGVSILLQTDKELFTRNRQPIILLFRSILEDLIVGKYLYAFRDDKISFQNELDVIKLDYLNFSKFIIENDVYFEFSLKEYEGIPLDERKKMAKKYLEKIYKKNSKLYENVDSVFKLKKPNKIRESSNEYFFNYRNIDGKNINYSNSKFSLGNIYKVLIGIAELFNSDDLRRDAYSYLLYRTLSQYQHFSLDVSENVLNKDIDFEIGLIHKSLKQTIYMLVGFLTVLEVSEEKIIVFDNIVDEFISDFKQ